MKPKFTIEQFEAAKGSELLPLDCEFCGKEFLKDKNRFGAELKAANYDFSKVTRARYCSKECLDGFKKRNSVLSNCTYCGKETRRSKAAFARISENPFCSDKCSKQFLKDKFKDRCVEFICDGCGNNFTKKKYRNKNSKYKFCGMDCFSKNHGLFAIIYSRSKLEKFVEKKIVKLYPNLKFTFNNRKKLGCLELDIYIPEIELAFEIDGPCHYFPIYGEEKFKAIKERDTRKNIQCKQNGIILKRINVSEHHYRGEESCLPYLKEITDFLDSFLFYRENPHALSDYSLNFSHSPDFSSFSK